MKPPNFDLVARPYRWLEYLTLGPVLQSCRTHFLPRLLDRKRALVLGDGDGRFLARLLAANEELRADAVDTSALEHAPSAKTDLIAAHFFFDCLTQPELDALIPRLAAFTQPNALWLVSDFRLPAGPLRPLAHVYVRALYFAFRLLTGLRVTHLPDHERPMHRAGLTRIAVHRGLFGLLTTELWNRA